MRLSGAVNAVPGTPGSGRQRQAGRCFLPLPAHPVGLETWGRRGSARAVLTGQAAPTTTSHRGCHHLSLDPERLKRARLHVERAIKVRGLTSQPPQRAVIACMA